MTAASKSVSHLCTWNNGQKAVVHLVQNSTGGKEILKIYRPGFSGWMFREYFCLAYLSKRLQIVPRLIAFRPFKKQLVISYIPGQRLLEWVLQNFGDHGLNLEEFLNFEAMDSDPRITCAFERFRQSTEDKACAIKTAIKQSYGRLHELGWQHGTSDPRNVIYYEGTAYIIDFDHARPGLSPADIDFPALTYWFGIKRT